MEESIYPLYSTWEPVLEAFLEWIKGKEQSLDPGLAPEPTIKILTFLALLDSEKACSYDDIREIFRKKRVIKGNVPDNTLRTSVLNLGKTLEKVGHHLELKSLRGHFQLIPRVAKSEFSAIHANKSRVLIIDDPIIDELEIAKNFVEKSMMPFNALYFLEWSARCWEIYSRREAEARVSYEAGALTRLNIMEKFSNAHLADSPLCMVSLGPSEGLAEIEILKRLCKENQNKKIHYLAIESSPRLLRNHMGLLREALIKPIESGQLLGAGIVADIFFNLREAIKRVRVEFKKEGVLPLEDFIPPQASLLVTYFGNCLGNDGNNAQDPEVGFFSLIHSVFPNRPMDILVGVSVMRSQPDEYKRNWDDFLLHTPKHFLTTSRLLESSREATSKIKPEFTLLSEKENQVRCPAVLPEPYLARHQIEGQIYRFYYRLAFDLKLASTITQEERQLPKGALILLYNIIKYNMETLVAGIEKIGLFKVKYDSTYHQIVNTENGVREYAVFSAYIEK